LKAEDQLSIETIEYLAQRPKSERSPLGQFITPKDLRDRLIAKIDIQPGMRILDPGVGTGEFLKSCYEHAPNLELHGWDIDPQVLEVASKVAPFAQLTLQSALDQDWKENFDVVIGNPPYFEMRNLEPKLKSRYRQVIGGRPNVFSLFFAAGLGALKPGGTLGFVVPPSMNNGAFFENLRKFILSKGSVESLEVFTDHSLFLDAQTAVQLITIKKGKKSDKHVVDLGAIGKTTQNRIVFSEDPEAITSEFIGKSTLWHLGYEAVTGTLVWNKNKDLLRKAASSDTIPLLWAHNITDDDHIVLNDLHEKKPQYVVTKNFIEGPAIIVNRITGSVGSGNLRCAIVPKGMKFIGENHVNVIRPRKKSEQLVDWMELLRLLRAQGINHRIQKLTGNTQVSCVELTYWLPLDTSAANLEKLNILKGETLFS
jgi:adenine-specific DNA-methyltransferase